MDQLKIEKDIIQNLGEPSLVEKKGITIHYSADNDSKRLRREMTQSNIGYHYLILEDGKIVQVGSLDLKMNHAGKAMWNAHSPNRCHIAIAFLGWGLLDKNHKTWSGIIADRWVDRRGNIWHPATDLQEKSLEMLVRHLMQEYKINEIGRAHV